MDEIKVNIVTEREEKNNTLHNLGEFSKIFSLIAIPIIVVIIGWRQATQISKANNVLSGQISEANIAVQNKNIGAQYVKLAISILKTEPNEEVPGDKELRRWSIKILNHYIKKEDESLEIDPKTGSLLVEDISIPQKEETSDSIASLESNPEYCEEHLMYGDIGGNGKKVCRLGYALSVDEEKLRMEWVSYSISSDMSFGKYGRLPFRIDKELSQYSKPMAVVTKGTNYDRGTMVSRSDMSWNQITNMEAMLTSVATPQHKVNNRTAWMLLERQARTLIQGNIHKKIVIVSGPIFDNNKRNIKYLDNIPIPKSFFRVHFSPSDMKIAAFILPNDETAKEAKALDGNMFIQKYSISIEDLEEITNFNFFSKLPIEQKGKLFKSTDASWFFIKDQQVAN